MVIDNKSSRPQVLGAHTPIRPLQVVIITKKHRRGGKGTKEMNIRLPEGMWMQLKAHVAPSFPPTPFYLYEVTPLRGEGGTYVAPGSPGMSWNQQ